MMRERMMRRTARLQERAESGIVGDCPGFPRESQQRHTPAATHPWRRFSLSKTGQFERAKKRTVLLGADILKKSY